MSKSWLWLVAAGLVACGGTGTSTTPPVPDGAPAASADAALSLPDAGVLPADSRPSPPLPDARIDAGTIDAPAAPGTLVVMQPVSGVPTPTTQALGGPGLILMGGGTDTDAAFIWMHDTLAGSATRKLGNIVVLRSDDVTDNAYTPYIYALAPFQSVMTIFLGPAGTATPADLVSAAHYVDEADGVFFAGGDQADYVHWKGSPLTTALSNLYARGGIIGGTSAGCSIQGPFVFDALAADAQGTEVETADAVAAPFESIISFTRDMFSWATLPLVITDPHFVTRDRFGRLAAFVARQYADGAAATGVVGVGIDEMNALLVDKNGMATLVQETGDTQSGTGAYILQPAAPATTCEIGAPLLYKNLKVMRLVPGDTFDFSRGCGTGVEFSISVDGSNANHPYSTSPYTASGTKGVCP